MDTDAILTLLKDVADQVVNPRFRTLSESQISEKNPGDLVTVADHEAEELITAALRDAYPEAVVLGEEAEGGDPDLLDRYAAAEHAFTVDPVDGTKNFVRGSPDHALMVAEVLAGSVVRSWIWQPQHHVAYVAERGGGAWRNGEPLVREPAPADPARRRAVTARRSWLGDEIGGMPPLELSWVCCGVDYARLVEGAADVMLYGRARPWDHAPGSLILTEAGGHLGLRDGTAYDPRSVVDGLVAAGDRTTYDDVVAALAP